MTLPLPRICLIGSRSSGKSLIGNSLIGIDILPTIENHNDCLTRRPIEVKLIHSLNATTPYGEINSDEENTLVKYEDIKILKNKIIELINKKPGMSNKEEIKFIKNPIRVKIYANNCVDITIIDLPGFAKENEKSLMNQHKQAKEIAIDYIIDESTTIIYVQDVDSFLHNNSGFSLDIYKTIAEYDQNKSRTIGVFTKIDLLQNDIFFK